MCSSDLNVTDPVESLMTSAIELQRAFAQSLLVDREALSAHQDRNDALMAAQTLKRDFPESPNAARLDVLLAKLASGAVKTVHQHHTGVIQQTLQALQVIGRRHQVILQLGCQEQGHLGRRGLDRIVVAHLGSTQPGFESDRLAAIWH